MTTSRKVILGVTASIAVSKAQAIANALQYAGFEVRAAMTWSAKQLISEQLLSGVLNAPVYSQIWNPAQGGETHINWAKWADAMLIAPATASCISELWAGKYDSCVTLLAANIPPERLFIAPAMSQNMWEQPAVQRNVEQLKAWGVRFIEPVTGIVASKATGQRLQEPSAIVDYLKQVVEIQSPAQGCE